MSGPALRLFLLLLGIFPILFPVNAMAQISPGELSRPHAFLDGMTKCLKCHKLGAKLGNSKCLDCHQEIQVRLRTKRGYHFTVVSQQKQSCVDCHGEHAGRDFELITWPDGGMQQFDHKTTGYVLHGKHRTLQCRQCHKPELIRDNLRQVQKKIDLSRTFLGLGKTCKSCHFDEHRGQLGNNCLKCHTQKAWKPVPKFNHNRTRFRLTGKHVRVACGKCHPNVHDRNAPKNQKRFFAKFTGLKFSACTDCHKDPHRGRFGKNCQKCHNTSGWMQVNTGTFDHSLTRFPLRGLHAKVACEKCHISGDLRRKLKFAHCRDCHQDIHAGQFAHRKDRGRCEACHDENGFTPAHFGLAQHARSRFPLVGAHQAIACTNCHKMRVTRAGQRVRNFIFPETSCTRCHKDIHAGQFSRTRPVKTCTQCHTQDAWTELLFDHERDSRFQLTGAHRNVDCRGCHKKVRFKNMVFILYRPIPRTCKTCHEKGGLFSR